MRIGRNLHPQKVPTLMLAVMLATSVGVTDCQRSPGHSSEEIVSAWAKLCVDGGVTEDHASAIAATYSLVPFDKGDLDERLNEAAIANRLAPTFVTFVKKTDGWWLNSKKDMAFYYASLSRTTTVLGTTRTSDLEACNVEGDAASFAEFSKELEMLPIAFSVLIPQNSDGS